MARASKNFVDKILEAVPTKQVAEKDPMHHIELELTGTLKQMFEEAKEGGFKGSFNEYLDSLSKDELKRIGVSKGGLISIYKQESRKP